MEKIKLAVVDDHPMIIKGIQFSLRSAKAKHIELVECYTNGIDFLNNLKSTNEINLVLVDLLMPDMLGDELIKRIIHINPGMKTGIYSSNEDKEIIVRAFEYGTLGYLSKSSGTDEFINYLDTISLGERYIPGNIASYFISRPTQYAQLTKREKEILKQMMEGKKNKEIADMLFISERTVEFHRKNIFSKFEVYNLLGLMKWFANKNLKWQNVVERLH